MAGEALGGLDILVANGGGPPPGTFATTDFERYLPALEQNLLSIVAMCQAAVPAMRAQHWGRVVAITSSSVRQPIPNLILSNTARAGATAFLKTLATRWPATASPSTPSSPACIARIGSPGLYGDNLEATAAGIPAGIVGDADDFGAAVAFLCSEQAKFITGVGLHIDGGAFSGLQ